MPSSTLNINNQPIGLSQFYQAVTQPYTINVSDAVYSALQSAHEHVQAAAQSDTPVYGLNTGLGANLGHRLSADEISSYQLQIIAGRAVACGSPLSPAVGKATLLSRIITAANGYSGISPRLYKHLVDVFNSGVSPVIPEYGSIGASDLTQNAHMGLAVCGLAPVWQQNSITEADKAFSALSISCPELQPKDGMALINHSGVTVALSAIALSEAKVALAMAKHAIVLSYLGYDANQSILSKATNELRPAPGQADAAAWFRCELYGSSSKPRRIQEALSFRTVAPIIGAAEHALEYAISVWELEANGTPDSPVIMPDGTMQSTANFHSPALAIALQAISTAMVSVANASAQRQQRLMDPALSGLPKYLSKHEGRSAGFVPSQKTALSLLADINHGAMPVMLNPTPVSEAVEDMATMAPQAATKLTQQLKPFRLLHGLESLVACQAIDLRANVQLSAPAQTLYSAIRANIPMLDTDRAMGPDINKATDTLREHCKE